MYRQQDDIIAGRRRAFTLIEVLIVVTILGIIAGVILVHIGGASEYSRRTAFVADLRSFANAANFYIGRTGMYLEDSSSGVFPAGWGDYVDAAEWEAGTPIGGVWDVELDSFGIKAGFGVHFNGSLVRDDAYMTEIDRLFDDGDLSTGVFRKLANDRYYYVLAAN